MVVKPGELEKVVTENDARVISEFEAKADRTLEQRYFSGKSVTIEAPRGSTNSEKVLAKIKEMYGEAGWTVKYHCDQRDGAYLTFSAKSAERAGGPYR